MNPRIELYAVATAAFAVGAIALRLYAARSQRARPSVRNLYLATSHPIVWRNAISVLPGWGVVVFAMGMLPLLPRSLVVWVLLPIIALALFLFILEYRVPAPFLPQWLREEIDRGETPVARPDRGDWVLFWVIFSIVVVGIAVAVVSLLVYKSI